MAPFNPYHKWLGIPPEQQPVSHYRLLGIEDFELDADVIEGAAEQRTIYLRTFQTGPNSELAERLLNEVSEARVCLLNAEDKSRYDQQLQVGAEHSRLKDVATATPERVIPRQEKSRPLANEDEVAVPVEPVAAEDSSTQERDWSFTTVKLPDDKDRRLVEPEQLAPLDQDPLGYSPDELVPTADQATSDGRTPGKQEKPFWQQPWAIPAAGGGIVVLLLLMIWLASGGDPSSPGDKPELADKQNGEVTSQQDEDRRDKYAVEKAAGEQIQDALRAGREKYAVEKVAGEQIQDALRAGREKAGAEKQADDKLAVEQAAMEKAAAEKAVREKAAAKLAAEQASAKADQLEDNHVVGPANGGFESSLLSWEPVTGSVSLSRNSYRGSNACLLVGGPNGASINSALVKVFEGRTYNLTSFVKQTMGTGYYKVTIAWKNPVGKTLRYDNDWKGINRPSKYTIHKGSFLAPENATTAVIMLGVAKETSVLFDDIVLNLKDNAYQIWACPDFRYDANHLFSPNSPWENAARKIDVFKLHIRELQDNDPQRNWKLNVGRMVEYLKENDIELGLEAAGTMGGTNCEGDTGRKSALAERALIDRIYATGGTVKYLMLDGSISRTIRGGRLKNDGGASGNCGYTLSQSVGHLVTYMKVIHAKYPEIEIGLGVNYDHWGFQGYKAFFGNKVENYTQGSSYRYNQVLDALLPTVAKAGEKIHFIHVDNPSRPYYVAAKSPFGGANLDQKGKLRSIQSYCASRNLAFGVMYNTQNARSNQDFFHETINMLKSHGVNGIQPKHLTVESWYANMPSEYLPDTKPYTFMNLVKQFGVVAERQRPGSSMAVDTDGE